MRVWCNCGGARSVDRSILTHCLYQTKKHTTTTTTTTTRLYLCVYLAARGAAGLEAEGVVCGLGAKSFTVLVPSLDLEHRLFLGDIPGLAPPAEGHDAAEGGVKTLTLRSSAQASGSSSSSSSLQPQQLPPWGAGPWTLRLFDRVRVRATSKADAVPLMVKLELLGPVLPAAGICSS